MIYFQEKVVLSGVAKYVPDGKLDAVLNVAGKLLESVESGIVIFTILSKN